jgi:hypothetical protein
MGFLADLGTTSNFSADVTSGPTLRRILETMGRAWDSDKGRWLKFEVAHDGKRYQIIIAIEMIWREDGSGIRFILGGRHQTCYPLEMIYDTETRTGRVEAVIYNRGNWLLQADEIK